MSVIRIKELRRKICLSRMADSHHFILPIDGFIKDGKLLLNDAEAVDPMSLSHVLNCHLYNLDYQKLEEYRYRPYLVKMLDLSMCRLANMNQINKQEPKQLFELFRKVNYGTCGDKESPIDRYVYQKIGITYVGNEDVSDIRVGISNTCYPDSDLFDNAVGNKDGRTATKLKSTNRIFNQAIKDSADVLVLPECYLPPEWLPYCVRTCMKNDMLLITGIEYVSHEKKMYNLMAIAMPFQDEYGHLDSYISFHLKSRYSPNEIKYFSSAGYKCAMGDNNEMFIWKGLRFTAFCCFEMADIAARAKFRSRIHALFAVECNRDVNYFDDIVGSTARDLHCYVVQVNNSKYGDSRITAPSKTETMNVARVSGGDNSVVVTGVMLIKDLIEFRRLEEGKENFKKKPPGFDVDLAEKDY